MRRALSAPESRELLLWCLPALFLSLALRVALMTQLPYAFFHDDTPDFLTTPARLLEAHHFELHEKKTFLAPIVFSVPILLPGPGLIVIPAIHHLLGMVLVAVVGVLCRLWFAHWKVFVLPLTLLAAANPFLLWYEHAIMAETLFVVSTALVALSGTLYARRPSRNALVFLCASLVLAAGARPEGRLFFGFGLLLLALVHASEWRSAWPRLVLMLVLAVVLNKLTKTSQTGLLLYTSVARLTPTDLRCAPGFDPFIAALRAELQARWEEMPSFPKVRDRRAVSEAVRAYLSEKSSKRARRSSSDNFCKILARETCLRNLPALPGYVYHKFRSVATESPAGRLDNEWLFHKQRDAYLGAVDRTLLLSAGLTGQTLSTQAELEAFFESHYREIPWFDTLSDRWLAAVNSWRLPDRLIPQAGKPGEPLIYPGLPWYFILAAAGLVLTAFRRDSLQRFHIAWALSILVVFFLIVLTGNVRSRFRLFFEPFWFLYAAMCLEAVYLKTVGPLRRRAVCPPASSVAPAPAAAVN